MLPRGQRLQSRLALGSCARTSASGNCDRRPKQSRRKLGRTSLSPILSPISPVTMWLFDQALSSAMIITSTAVEMTAFISASRPISRGAQRVPASIGRAKVAGLIVDKSVRGRCQSKFYTACPRIRAGWSSTVFAHESPTRSTGFDAENGLYLFALTVPSKAAIRSASIGQSALRPPLVRPGHAERY